jgi:hypothetical protein
MGRLIRGKGRRRARSSALHQAPELGLLPARHLGRKCADRARRRPYHHRRPAEARGGIVASPAPGGKRVVRPHPLQAAQIIRLRLRALTEFLKSGTFERALLLCNIEVTMENLKEHLVNYSRVIGVIIVICRD